MWFTTWLAFRSAIRLICHRIPESPPSMGGLPFGTGSLSSTSQAKHCLRLHLKLSRSHCIFILFLTFYFVSRLVSEFSVFDPFSQVWVWNPSDEEWEVSDHTDPDRMANWVNFLLRLIQRKVNSWRSFVKYCLKTCINGTVFVFI